MNNNQALFSALQNQAYAISQGIDSNLINAVSSLGQIASELSFSIPETTRSMMTTLAENFSSLSTYVTSISDNITITEDNIIFDEDNKEKIYHGINKITSEVSKPENFSILQQFSNKQLILLFFLLLKFLPIMLSFSSKSEEEVITKQSYNTTVNILCSHIGEHPDNENIITTLNSEMFINARINSLIGVTPNLSDTYKENINQAITNIPNLLVNKDQALNIINVQFDIVENNITKTISKNDSEILASTFEIMIDILSFMISEKSDSEINSLIERLKRILGILH